MPKVTIEKDVKLMCCGVECEQWDDTRWHCKCCKAIYELKYDGTSD